MMRCADIDVSRFPLLESPDMFPPLFTSYNKNDFHHLPWAQSAS
jgi:hypothetical protein